MKSRDLSMSASGTRLQPTPPSPVRPSCAAVVAVAVAHHASHGPPSAPSVPSSPRHARELTIEVAQRHNTRRRSGAGFAVVGTVLDKPHCGNQWVLNYFNPWLPLPFSGAGLNSLGLPSKGVGKAITNIKKFREKWQPQDFPIGVSIMGHPAQSGQEKLDGVLECVRQAVREADFIEINESCPNVAHGHGDSSELEARLAAVVGLSLSSLLAVGASVT